jgi:hypothetical protein
MQFEQLDEDQLKSLLHYMKGCEPFSKIFRDLTRTRRQWCPFTHEGVGIDNECYRSNTQVQAVLAYTKKYATCCSYLDCHAYTIQDIERACQDLAVPERMSSLKEFDACLSLIRDSIAFIEDDISEKLRRFTCLECERLDEAIECLRNYCFYASVVMAVSAVEARITEIVKKHDKALYDAQFAKATLGQLVQLFDDKHYTEAKYSHLKRLMPDKHKPLVALLNQYRVFSAHPKTERITYQIADAILKLSFTFMIDPATCAYKAEKLKCR